MFAYKIIPLETQPNVNFSISTHSGLRFECFIKNWVDSSTMKICLEQYNSKQLKNKKRHQVDKDVESNQGLWELFLHRAGNWQEVPAFHNLQNEFSISGCDSTSANCFIGNHLIDLNWIGSIAAIVVRIFWHFHNGPGHVGSNLRSSLCSIFIAPKRQTSDKTEITEVFLCLRVCDEGLKPHKKLTNCAINEE